MAFEGRGRRRTHWLVAIGLALGLGASEASAARFGTLGASTGLVATLLAVFALKGWPAVASASTVSTAGSALLLAAAVAWLMPERQRTTLSAFGTRLLPSWLGPRDAPEPSGVPLGGVDPGLEARLVAIFLRVQGAWDGAERHALQDCLTAEMFDELMQEREHCLLPQATGKTEFVEVEPEVLGMEMLGSVAMLSVVFSGRLREEGGNAPIPFRELWLLTRAPTPDADWKLARHQALY